MDWSLFIMLCTAPLTQPAQDAAALHEKEACQMMGRELVQKRIDDDDYTTEEKMRMLQELGIIL
jgi:hypothetical protein